MRLLSLVPAIVILDVIALFSVHSPAVETFHMEQGACLRGPLVIRDVSGNEMLRLEAGVYYPSGCQ